MKNKAVIDELLKRRSRLSQRIAWHQAELARATDELASLNVAIMTEKLGHAPTERARKGAVVRLIINSLRASQEPMTARQLAILHTQALGLDPDDKRLAHTMRERIRRTLRRLKSKGIVREVPMSGYRKGWEMTV